MPRDTKAPAEKLSPSAFMRQLRPELYSDTIDRTTYQLDAPTLGYHLETITARNQTHDFEIFCRKLCQRAICPNLKPATGPEGGGDSKADTETISIADEIGVLTYVGDANAGRERWAFAFSAKKKWAEKVRKDVAAIVATARGYHKIYCVTAQFARAKDLHASRTTLPRSTEFPSRSWIAPGSLSRSSTTTARTSRSTIWVWDRRRRLRIGLAHPTIRVPSNSKTSRSACGPAGVCRNGDSACDRGFGCGEVVPQPLASSRRDRRTVRPRHPPWVFHLRVSA
jgi:hypothetical protein